MKIVWITGGSTGIGLATAIKFSENNWKVVISSSDIKKLQKAKNKILTTSKNSEVYLYQCDIANRKQVWGTVNQITKDLGNIELAILNAAAYSPNKNQDFSIDNYEHLINVNLKGTLYCLEILIEKMIMRKS